MKVLSKLSPDIFDKLKTFSYLVVINDSLRFKISDGKDR